MAKFTDNEVLEIYYSCDSIDTLVKKYNVTRYNIISIKRKIYYKNVTKDIKELPGFCMTDMGIGKTIPIPMDLIEKIFYDTGDYDHFWNKYHATKVVVRSIKSKKSFKKITNRLGQPGQIKRYNLTNNEVEYIITSAETLDELSEKFKVHRETIRNIKKGITRGQIWDDF